MELLALSVVQFTAKMVHYGTQN